MTIIRHHRATLAGLGSTCTPGAPTPCGHDIGAYVAFVYALSYRDDMRALITVDAPLPGTRLGDSLAANPGTWRTATPARRHRHRDHPPMTGPSLAAAYDRGP